MPTDYQLLGTFLTMEGFLLAAVSLSANLSAPGRWRPSLLPFPVSHITVGAAVTSCIVGIGAAISWWSLYVGPGGDWLPMHHVIQAAVLLLAAIAQPIIAILLSVAALEEKS